MLIPIVIYIQNRIAFCLNLDILVKVVKMKTGVLLVDPIDKGVCIVASALLIYCVDVVTNRAG